MIYLNPPQKVRSHIHSTKQIKQQHPRNYRISRYPLKETEQDGEPEHDKPHNVNQKESLAGERSGSSVPNFTETQLRHLGSCARGFGAAAPVGHAVGAAHRVRPEALRGARRRRRSGTKVMPFAGGHRR